MSYRLSQFLPVERALLSKPLILQDMAASFVLRSGGPLHRNSQGKPKREAV
jgi:hypothetical protein